MKVSTEMAWKSLNKYKEELCGDKVELLKLEDSDVVILADGMGSGVKANILATLTSKILRTMFAYGEPIEKAVSTIAKTLPICSVRQVAYSTFSILQVFHNGDAYLVEFDNPSCIFIRNRTLSQIPFENRQVEGKNIRECRFKVQPGDCFVLMSDGTIFAGVGEILNFGWTWDSMAEYAVKCTKKTLSASRIASMLSQACDELYMQRPGDDTTVAVAHVMEQKIVSLFTGPPKDMDDDSKIMKAFMDGDGKKVVCGGTTAKIAARYLNSRIVNNDDGTAQVPPTSSIQGLDLVTEGVLTLNQTVKLLREYAKDEVDPEIFILLDENNGAARLADMLIENCTLLKLYVGTAENSAQGNLVPEISIRKNIVEQLKAAVEALEKNSGDHLLLSLPAAGVLADRHCCKYIHNDKVAEAAAHDKQMEDFMGTEIFVPSVKYRQLHSVNNAADGVNNAAGQKPQKSACGQCVQNPGKRQEANPAHANIKDRRNPLGAVDPKGFKNNACQGNGPDQNQHSVANGAAYGDNAYRRIGSGNKDKDHHMIQLFQTPVYLIINIQRMVNGAGGIQGDHADDKDRQGNYVDHVRSRGGFYDQRKCGQESHKPSDKMCNGAAGIFWSKFHNISPS